MSELDTLSISFSGEASETFRIIVSRMDSYCVRLTPLDGSEPFDAIIKGSAPIGGVDLCDYRQVWFLLADDDGFPIEGAQPQTLLVKDVYVY